MSTASRLERLRRSMAGRGLGALVVTNLTNVRYLTGFSGSAALLAVTASDALLLTDGRYAIQAPAEVRAAGAEVEVEIPPTPSSQLSRLVGLVGPLREVGLEAEHVAWAFERRLADGLAGASSEASLVPTASLVEEVRLSKDDGELVRMAAAAAVADAALVEVLASVRPGRSTEADLALALDTGMRRLGASGVAFETIVASGPNGAKPHAHPSAKIIEPGELVVIDFGATVDGYRSDMTRTVCFGEPASETLASIVSIVEASQAAGVAAVAEGVEAREVDRACRRLIAEAGYADAFVHSTGHGVGLDVHEAPAVAERASARLEGRSVVTVEPGIYLDGIGGCRIEDTVVVVGSGSFPLTAAPKQLIVA